MAGQSPPPQVPLGPWGRSVVGLCTFLSSLSFGAFAVYLQMMVMQAPQMLAFWRLWLADVGSVLFATVSLFLLFLAIGLWSGGSRWTGPLLNRIRNKGVFDFVVIGAAFLAFAIIADPLLAGMFGAPALIPLLITMSVLRRMEKRNGARAKAT